VNWGKNSKLARSKTDAKYGMANPEEVGAEFVGVSATLLEIRSENPAKSGSPES
jgi:hypothetical protein